jgi:DNA-binding MarR family transcriptional regulator
MAGTQQERENLVQELIERMMGIMRKVRHDAVPNEPLLSMPQLHILFSIAMKKGGVSVSELAELSGVTPGAVTQFVNALAEKDLVARESDPSDRRIVRLRITPRARGQLERLRRDHLAAAAHAFDVLSLEDIRTLNEILGRLNVPLEKEELPPDGRRA